MAAAVGAPPLVCPLGRRWLGTVGYARALEAQRTYREAVITGREQGEMWLLEHPPVVTTGRRAVELDSSRIAEAGFEIADCERGGLATCHEPGQLVGYILANVREAGVRRAVCAIESGLIDWLGQHGVLANRHPDHPGVWVGGAKIAALGLHVRRGVTLHGFALNLCNSLRGFELIVPCGISGARATRFFDHSATPMRPELAWESVGAAVAKALAAAGVGAQTLDSPADGG